MNPRGRLPATLLNATQLRSKIIVEIGIDPHRSRDACFSPCRKYRYVLWRRFQAADGLDLDHLNPVVFIMLNPSKADNKENDTTMDRVESITESWGHNSVLVCNLFAYIESKSDKLLKVNDPFGPKNEEAIDWTINFARRFPKNTSTELKVVCAWGTKGHPHCRKIIDRLKEMDAELWCLGLNGDGSPRHPKPQGRKLTEKNFKLYFA
ncbi:MAG: DUF1643 domain-containing protein [Synechococcus sp. SB0677_bin_5]|nr:DUF1643 domain-containing protein [Synechococcus sp. SB0677_bin_5]